MSYIRKRLRQDQDTGHPESNPLNLFQRADGLLRFIRSRRNQASRQGSGKKEKKNAKQNLNRSWN